MGLRKKQQSSPEPDPKVIRRVRMVETPELVPWAEAAIYEMGRSLSEYRKDAEPHHLADALQASMLGTELIMELQARQASASYAPHGSALR